MNMNYNEIMKKEISSLDSKKTLLLHCCCAPCASSVIEKLEQYFDLTILFYNPNILPQSEYEKRKEELKRFLNDKKIKFVEGEYKVEDYLSAIKGFETFSEKSERCYKCYELRIKYTADKAKELKFDYFTTTLSVSPHKIASWINEIGQKYQTENCKFLISDFKKENGYLRSLELSKEYDFYRQNYCGCTPSVKD